MEVSEAIELLRENGYKVEKIIKKEDITQLPKKLIIAEGVDGIIRRVCYHCGITKSQLLNKTRHRFLVEARQLAHHIAKKYLDMSLAEIGCAIGFKDHATVLYSIRMVGELLSADKLYCKRYEDIITIYDLKPDEETH